MGLIVIDGLDGSGKTTQFKRVGDILSERFKVKTVSFPDYASESSALIRMYLNGDFGACPEDVGAYAASSFYAADRFASFRLCWEENYKNGDMILASRYVSSNAIHQMGKIPKPEWNSYLDWLYDFEYDKLGLPVPDLVVFLDMPPEAAAELLRKRYGGDESKKDIHESDARYLQKCREAALYAAERDGWAVIKCGEKETPFPPGAVTGEIIKKISEVNAANA